ncbi:MAG: transglutaminase domain-containing protein [Eubacteriales bacterium]|nr:transglutaminase domain-containing protein [Eubacteriales bacterium]
MKKRWIMSLALVLLLLVSVGCSRMDGWIDSQKNEINSLKELETQIEEALKKGEKELSFVTTELSQEDLRELNQSHDGFYGTVSSYEIRTMRILRHSQVTLHCDISENFYVERAMLDGEAIPSDNRKALRLKEVCESILPQLEEADSDYKKEKKIHDYLVRKVAYGYPEGREEKDSTGYTAYGALVEGKAVCNGYAQAMKLLCDISGVECEMISGRADGENHAWNLVRLEGALYHVDVTWDDPEPDDPDRILYSYFNLDDAQMGLSHQWEKSFYEKAEGKKYQYYYKNDLYCESIEELSKKCEQIFESDTPERFQVLVGDYEEEKYTEQNLQFIFRYSGARYMRLQTIGEAPCTTLYVILDY